MNIVVKMDKFDVFLEQIKVLGPQQVKDIFGGFKLVCDCPKCPSYNECARQKDELLFCLLGKGRNCKYDELGCICKDCPVFVDIEMRFIYYCRVGSEKELRGKG